ncbi:hypothetical protein KW429_11335 [Vibrio fluvialis]|nr:hypothetical protein [Vibrio fluvialis]MBY7902300.1 hypothetical protein [Vibrio fluvialis]
MNLDQHIKNQITHYIDDAKRKHDLSGGRLNVRLQLINDTLKLKIGVREWRFSVQVNKSVDGMIATNDCDALMQTATSTTEILTTELERKIANAQGR